MLSLHRIEAGLSLLGLPRELPDTDPHDEYTSWADARRAVLAQSTSIDG